MLHRLPVLPATGRLPGIYDKVGRRLPKRLRQHARHQGARELARRAKRIAAQGAATAALLFAAGCGGFASSSLESWPARDQLYARHCRLEVQRGRLPAAAFDDCYHQLKEHRGEVCTHKR
jgi:hypothetical protein